MAAEQGIKEAQHNLGVMYANGRGVVKDDKEAVKWYRMAAEQGYAAAQSNLGIMYAAGLGVVQDSILALMWFNIASSNGSKKGVENREKIIKIMTSEQISNAQNLAREWGLSH